MQVITNPNITLFEGIEIYAEGTFVGHLIWSLN